MTQSIEKLYGSRATGQSNYNAWRFRIVQILKEKDLLAALEDPAVSTTKDDQAFTIITLNIKDSQIPYIQDMTTTKDAWAALKEVHQGIGMNGRMVLMQRLWSLKMVEGDDMAQHLNRFRELANQLRSLSLDGKGMDDSELVTILTLSLPESYEPLVMALQSRSDTVTFDTMAGRLFQESGRRQITMVTQSVQGSSTSPQTAFTTHQAPMAARGGRGRQGRGRGGYRSNGREIFRGTVTSELRGNTRVMGAYNPQTTKCHYCGKTEHWKKDCYKKRSDDAAAATTSGDKAFTFLAESPRVAPGIGWIIDSGASQHISHDSARFTTYTHVSKAQAITIADGTRLEACGIGNIEISTKAGCITLTDGWHVPTIETNLISVARMVDAGFTVQFSKSICTVSKGGINTELGHRYGALYHLDAESAAFTNNQNPPNQINLGLSTNQSPSATRDTWHRRLCHRTLNDTTLKYIATRVRDMEVSEGTGEAVKICGICALGRQHKEVQTKEREKPSELLSVVHSDICGPMQTPCLTGERYFVTFTDERSGRVSICLLRTKDGALDAFQLIG